MGNKPNRLALEEGRERVVAAATARALVHRPVGGDAVLQAVQLPAGVADLHTGLAHVNAQTLPHLALIRESTEILVS